MPDSSLIISNDSLESLMHQALEVLEGYAALFREKIGAPRYIDKGVHDFSTALDLYLEKSISQALIERTGIDVFGEEFGGKDRTDSTIWVIDPIDGTANYSAGLPIAGILLALLRDNVPVIGICYVPTMNQIFSAYEGSPLYFNGEAQSSLASTSLGGELVGFGSFQIDSQGKFPGIWRINIMSEISRATSRLRMLGSTGLTTAYVASGTFAGAVIFGSNIWDNATGYILVRAAGGIVTDLFGKPWTTESAGMLLAAPGAYEELMEIISQFPLEHFAETGNLAKIL